MVDGSWFMVEGSGIQVLGSGFRVSEESTLSLRSGGKGTEFLVDGS